MDGENVDALLQAQAHVWNHTLSFIRSMSLKIALQLEIPDIIHNHGRPMSIFELASALPIRPQKLHSLHRFMRFLVHSGFFVLQENGYVLTDASRLLLKDKPLSARKLVLLLLDPFLTKPWDCLGTWLQNDDPTPFYTANGSILWDYVAQEPEMNHFLNDGMADDGYLAVTAIVSKCKGVFDGLKSMVDVGGNTGTTAKLIAKAFPEMECTVFDLPHVVEGLQDSGNLKFLSGNMFEKIPPADAILFKWVLHDWDNEKCLEALRRSREAARKKVMIIDMVVGDHAEDEKSTETQLFFDMAVLSWLPGKQRSEEEWAQVFVAAGFSNYKINPVVGLRSFIEVYP